MKITSSCKWTEYHPHILPRIQLCFYQHAISINTFSLWIFTTVYSSAIRNTVTILCFVISCTISNHLKKLITSLPSGRKDAVQCSCTFFLNLFYQKSSIVMTQYSLVHCGWHFEKTSCLHLQPSSLKYYVPENRWWPLTFMMSSLCTAARLIVLFLHT